MNINIAKTFVALAVVAIGAQLNSATSSAQEKSAANNPRVPATVKGYETAALYAKVGGYLKSIDVDLGDEVAAGQTLAVIDVPEMERTLVQKEKHLALAEAEKLQADAAIDEARAHLEAMEASIEEAQSMRAQKEALFGYEQNEYQRMANLAARGSVQSSLVDGANYKMKAAQSELFSVDAKVKTARANLSGGNAAIRRAQADSAAAEAKVDVARADVEYIQQMLNYATIKAPWAGKITNRMYDPGAFVQSADGNSSVKPMFVLVRDDKLRVTFSLSQKDIAHLEKGVKVSLSDIDALPKEVFEGTVSRYSAGLDAETRMMQVEMDLDNADGKLKPGFFGYATIHFDK